MKIQKCVIIATLLSLCGIANAVTIARSIPIPRPITPAAPRVAPHPTEVRPPIVVPPHPVIVVPPCKRGENEKSITKC